MMNIKKTIVLLAAVPLLGWGNGMPVLESPVLVAPDPGALVKLNLTTGTDSEPDGLPDEWERQLMAASQGVITSISQITPDGDFDGDGAFNMNEYLAGTFAFLDFDHFSMDDLDRTEDGLIVFRFLSAYGKSYQVDMSAGLGGTNTWGTGNFSLDSFADLSLIGLIGDGDYKTIYVDGDGDQKFLRLIAK